MPGVNSALQINYRQCAPRQILAAGYFFQLIIGQGMFSGIYLFSVMADAPSLFPVVIIYDAKEPRV